MAKMAKHIPINVKPPVRVLAHGLLESVHRRGDVYQHSTRVHNQVKLYISTPEFTHGV